MISNEFDNSRENIVEETNTDDLSIMTNFLWYESSFVALMFLELFWSRLDMLIVSVYFTSVEIATQSTWMSSVLIIDSFSFGLGIASGSKISKYIVQKKITTAKKISLMTFLIAIFFGVFFGIILWTYSEAWGKLIYTHLRLFLKIYM